MSPLNRYTFIILTFLGLGDPTLAFDSPLFSMPSKNIPLTIH